MAREPKPGPTFAQQYAMAQAFMKFPALTLMVFLRRDLGYRLLNPLVLFAVFGVLAVIAILAMPGNEAARPVDLLIFAGLGFFSGLAQRFRRWREMERNVRQHSYYIGTSPFDQHWMPVFFRRHRRTARILDPVVCAAIGLALLPFSRALALWLIFSAFCLRAHEDGIFNRERNEQLDTSDSLIESEIQGQTVESFSQPPDPNQNPPAEPSVPTGLGDDIQTHLKRRQKK
jgi:hypothetical protein